jgi:hypothetical protein
VCSRENETTLERLSKVENAHFSIQYGLVSNFASQQQKSLIAETTAAECGDDFVARLLIRRISPAAIAAHFFFLCSNKCLPRIRGYIFLDQYFPVLKWIAYLFELLGRRTLSWLP